jgi:hypothetical protein
MITLSNKPKINFQALLITPNSKEITAITNNKWISPPSE